MVITAAPRSPDVAKAAISAPAARATSSRVILGLICGAPRTPASITITSAPCCLIRLRTKSNSAPFVSSVPIKTTVGIAHLACVICQRVTQRKHLLGTGRLDDAGRAEQADAANTTVRRWQLTRGRRDERPRRRGRPRLWRRVLPRRPRRRRLRRAPPAPTHLSGRGSVARQNCVTPYNHRVAWQNKLTRHKASSTTPANRV